MAKIYIIIILLLKILFNYILYIYILLQRFDFSFCLLKISFIINIHYQ